MSGAFCSAGTEFVKYFTNAETNLTMTPPGFNQPRARNFRWRLKLGRVQNHLGLIAKAVSSSRRRRSCVVRVGVRTQVVKYRAVWSFPR